VLWDPLRPCRQTIISDHAKGTISARIGTENFLIDADRPETRYISSTLRNERKERVRNAFRERRPVYEPCPRGCGLINDLFDPPAFLRGCFALP